MTRETGLWRWLRGAVRVLRSDLHMCRVENSTMRGMPDVEGHLRHASQFWIELKTADVPRRPETPVRFKVRDREAQVAWLERRWRLGGRAWLLLQVGSGRGRRLYLVPGLHAEDVYRGLPGSRLQELSVLDGDQADPAAIIERAAGRS